MTKDTILLRLLKEDHITLEEFRILDNPGSVIQINPNYIPQINPAPFPFNPNAPFPFNPNVPYTCPYPTTCGSSNIYESGETNTRADL